MHIYVGIFSFYYTAASHWLSDVPLANLKIIRIILLIKYISEVRNVKLLKINIHCHGIVQTKVYTVLQMFIGVILTFAALLNFSLSLYTFANNTSATTVLYCWEALV